MRKVKVRDLKRVVLALHIGSRFENAPGGGSHSRFYTAENRMYPVPTGNGLSTDLDWVYVKKLCKMFAIDEEELKKLL